MNCPTLHIFSSYSPPRNQHLINKKFAQIMNSYYYSVNIASTQYSTHIMPMHYILGCWFFSMIRLSQDPLSLSLCGMSIADRLVFLPFKRPMTVWQQRELSLLHVKAAISMIHLAGVILHFQLIVKLPIMLHLMVYLHIMLSLITIM